MNSAMTKSQFTCIIQPQAKQTLCYTTNIYFNNNNNTTNMVDKLITIQYIDSFFKQIFEDHYGH